MKNPPWTRDEMILAADVADDLGWGGVNASVPKVAALSKLLRAAGLHDSVDMSPSLRSPNSVAMKINNLRASHPEAQGTGLRTTAAERTIVEEFLSDRPRMKSVAVEIRTRLPPDCTTP